MTVSFKPIRPQTAASRVDRRWPLHLRCRRYGNSATLDSRSAACRVSSSVVDLVVMVQFSDILSIYATRRESRTAALRREYNRIHWSKHSSTLDRAIQRILHHITDNQSLLYVLINSTRIRQRWCRQLSTNRGMSINQRIRSMQNISLGVWIRTRSRKSSYRSKDVNMSKTST